MYKFFNPNPRGKAVGDCAVRALSKALDISWDDAYSALAIKGMCLCDMPSANAVWGDVLRDNGFCKSPDTDCVSLIDFCDKHEKGTYVVALPNHVVAVECGDYFDAFDSGNEQPIYFYFMCVKGE